MSEKIKFYMDEHVSRSVIAGLRRRGVDVHTTREAGMLGASDREHLALTSIQKRVIFSQDDDFLRLHARGFDHSGIIYAHPQTPIGDIIHGLMLIYQVLTTDEMQNHVEFL